MRRSAKRFINHIRTDRGMSPATVSSYEDDLKKFISFAETRVGCGLLPGDVTPGLIQEFLEFLGNTGYRKKNVASSRAKRLVTIRSFFGYLHREGLLGHDPAAAVKVPKVVHAEPHYLQQEDCHVLLQGARRHPNGFVVQRDQALLATFLATGARVSELIRADLSDLDLKGKRIRLHRKGGDVQSLPLSEHALSYLSPYLTARRRRTHCRAVFVSVRGQRLTQQSNYAEGRPGQFDHICRRWTVLRRLNAERADDGEPAEVAAVQITREWTFLAECSVRVTKLRSQRRPVALVRSLKFLESHHVRIHPPEDRLDRVVLRAPWTVDPEEDVERGHSYRAGISACCGEEGESDQEGGCTSVHRGVLYGRALLDRAKSAGIAHG